MGKIRGIMVLNILLQEIYLNYRKRERLVYEENNKGKDKSYLKLT